MTESHTFTIIAAINDHLVAQTNLLGSPLLQEPNVQFIPAEGFTSASRAYNHGITEATGELLIFAHQDVYMPAPWRKQLLDSVAMVDNMAGPWAVLGIVGVDGHGLVQGHSWSTGIGQEVGISVQQPQPAVSLDELILVVKKSSGLFFDENFPGWHLYGTDIVQTALDRGFGAYIISAPVIHNSLPVIRLDAGFVECYRYLRRKWFLRLPIWTCCIRLTRFGWPLMKKRIRQLLATTDRSSFARLPDPAAKARELGYE